MRTPYYTFRLDTIKGNYFTLSSLLSSCAVHYSTKANSDSTLLKALSTYAAGFEICSTQEFDFFCSINYDVSKLCYGIPIKDESTIIQLYAAGCRYFVFASEAEFIKLKRHAPQAKKILRMRVTDFSKDSIPYGMNLEEVTWEMAQETDGILFHISNTNLDEHMEALDRLERFVQKYDMQQIILNVGGSYYSKNPGSFFPVFNNRLEVLRNKYKLRLIAEAGSAIVNTAGMLNTKVLHIERCGNVSDVYIDAGFPAGVLCVPEQIINLSAVNNDGPYLYRFIDTTCLRKVLFIKRVYCAIGIGDILQFVNYGAYSLCYINKFHNQYEPHIKYISS